jgi:GT2 family glycosyltransferase
MHIVALTTCHNRCTNTLASLHDLYSQELPIGVTMTVAIVDDGSSDGTFDMVALAYPNVNIILGNGNLYWAGGMRFGWHRWVKTQSFDALMVFNDDIRLMPNALIELIEVFWFASETKGGSIAVSGAFRDEFSEKVTYGGYIHSSAWHRLRFKMVAPTGSPQQIDTLNMNCALISRSALERIGFLKDYFIHGGADMDFGLRLRKAGGSVWLTKKFIGWCSRNESQLSESKKKHSIRDGYKSITSIKGEPIAVRFLYYREHGGPLWMILFLGIYLRLILRALR